MLYKLRTGDILLAEDKKQHRTNIYLITFEVNNIWGLRCITCGELVGTFSGQEMLKRYIDEFLNIVQIIPKELVVECINKEYSLSYPVKTHDTFSEHELNLEFDFEK